MTQEDFDSLCEMISDIVPKSTSFAFVVVDRELDGGVEHLNIRAASDVRSKAMLAEISELVGEGAAEQDNLRNQLALFDMVN